MNRTEDEPYLVYRLGKGTFMDKLLKQLKIDGIEYEIQEMQVWNRTYGVHLKDYYHKINNLLEQHLEQANMELISLFADQAFAKAYFRDDTITQLKVIVEIYRIEKENNVKENTILDHGFNISDLISYFLKLKFVIWRIEFDSDSDAIKCLLNFRNQYRTSVYSMIGVLATASCDKVNAAYSIAFILRWEGRHEEAFHILNYALEIEPQEERLLCEMADICFVSGLPDQMEQYTLRIANPTDVYEGYKKRWGR
ncbi:hypothetical protein LQZ18_05075 [Lachnospiraceae bacterium ZAX-1]